MFSLCPLKHHVSALLKFGVIESRKWLQNLRKNGTNITSNAWIIKVIRSLLRKHPEDNAWQPED
jgi:hypothetical protein